MNVHLLVFDNVQIDGHSFRDKIDLIESIKDWTLFFGNTMCLVSEKDASALSADIKYALPNVRFLITTVDPKHRAGWLPKQLWRFMNESVSANSDSDA